jgi:SAM-dependent MidA family methyltransferase
MIRFNIVGLLSASLSSAALGASENAAASRLPESPATEALTATSRSFHFDGLLDLDRMDESDVSRRLLQRASLWNFRRLPVMERDGIEDDSLKQLFYMAALGDIFAAAAGREKKEAVSLEKTLRRMGCSMEMILFAKEYVPERARGIVKQLDIGNREARRRLACEFLDLALHSRQEVSLCLFLARRLATLSGMDWPALIRYHRESRSEYEQELISFLQNEASPVPFDLYYEHAMFNPRAGTYTGRTADHLIAADPQSSPECFFTTASYDPILAKAILCSARKLWERLGRPGRFDLVEMGAGMGKLADAVLSLVQDLPKEDPFRASSFYTIVEKSPALARIQKERLERFGNQVEVVCRSAVHGPLPAVRAGYLFSNELVDMFPPRKVLNLGGRLFEGYVAYRGGLIQEVTGPVREETAVFLEDRGIRLKAGESYFIQTDIDRWIATLDQALESGEVVTIDYGERRDALRAARSEFGRPMFRGYMPLTDPKYSLGVASLSSYRDSPTGVARPKDMTVDVDFTAIEEAVSRTHSLRPTALLSQRDFTRRACGEEPKIGHFNSCRVSLLSKGV